MFSRYIFKLFLVILFSCFPTFALACSVAPSVVPWAPGYKIYNHIDKEKPLSEFDSISVVKPLFEEVSKKDFEEFRYTQQGSEKYAHVKFKVLKTLKGKKAKSFYLRGGGSGFETVRSKPILRKLKKSIILNPHYLSKTHSDDEIYAYAHKRKLYEEAFSIAQFRAGDNYHRTMQFLDLFDLTIPRIGEPTTSVTCGSHIEYTVFPNMTYIAFKKGDRIVYLEPIENEAATLVEMVSAIIRENSLSDFSKTLPQFLKNKHIVVFEISSCPTKKDYLDRAADKLPALKNTQRYKNVRRSSNKEYYTFPYSKFDILYNSQTWRPSHRPVGFSLAYIDSYFDSVGDVKLECRVGDMYLAFTNTKYYGYNPVYQAFRSQSEKFDWRFLRIENQSVISSDLKTNIEITGPEKIPLSEILR